MRSASALLVLPVAALAAAGCGGGTQASPSSHAAALSTNCTASAGASASANLLWLGGTRVYYVNGGKVISSGGSTALPAFATAVGFRACSTPLLLYTVGSELQAKALTARGGKTVTLGRNAVLAPDGSVVSYAGNRIRYAGGSSLVAHLPLNWKITSVVVSPRDPHAFLVSAQSPEAGVELCGKGLGGIYRISPTGSKTILVDNPCHDHPQAAWSPDGAAISYVGAERDLYTLDSSGAHLRRVVSGGQVLQYLWSPDGTRIAYATKRGSADVVALAGGSTRTLGRGAPLAWSPNGRDVAVAAAGKPLIESVSATGAGSRVLLRLPKS